MERNEFIEYLKSKKDFTKEYNTNTIIFNENEYCDTVGIVLSGDVLVASYTYNGAEIVFKKLKANSLFGHSLIFSTNPIYRGAIICKKKCKIAYIEKNNFLKIISDQNNITTFLSMLSDDVLASKEKARILSFASTSDRLLYMLNIYKKIQFESISSLALEMSVTRESLSRTIKKLSREQIITLEGKCIKLVK